VSTEPAAGQGGFATADLFLLSQVQMPRIERYFPRSHGIARVDDRRIVSASVLVIKNGLCWRDAPRDYGPHKTIYNRFVRWSRGRVQQDFRRTGAQRRQTGADHDRRHAFEGAPHGSKPFKKGPVPRRIGARKAA
jgi:putative transposase